MTIYSLDWRLKNMLRKKIKNKILIKYYKLHLNSSRAKLFIALSVYAYVERIFEAHVLDF